MSVGPSVGMLLLAMVALVPCAASRRGDGESGESKMSLRPGTRCQLLSRDVLTEADRSQQLPAVHRLRFSLPGTAQTAPECCAGESGMLHVRIKAPKAPGQAMRLNPYSAHLVDGNKSFELVVKIYPSGGPPTSPGVSAYLGALLVGEYAHVPEVRALDWRRDSRRTGMVCFGVGITECLGPARKLLEAGAEVRLIYANRHAGQILMREEYAALLNAYPTRFRIRHCLSQPTPGAPPLEKLPGERATKGRVDYKVLKAEFGGAWADGEHVQHFFMIGTTAMERAVLGMIGRAQLADFAAIRGHPEFLLMKGPHGHNSDWTRLSPPSEASRLPDEL